ncbi:phosphoadenosine phosphosulfate reductase [bacterium 336/3]|nr:phosphoadenosine phosphosulfate reductase [bacterium 336/3]
MDQDFLNNLIAQKGLEESLLSLSKNISERIVFSTSFSVEDQIITHAILSQNIKNIDIFTLDTGRFFAETYQVWDRTVKKYNYNIKPYYPNNQSIEQYVQTKGINAFYESVDLRKECCFIRKVEPLKRALQGAKLWITGIRAEHSTNRSQTDFIEWDEANQLHKYNPLLHWSTQEVESYVKKYNIPYNVLQDKGFVSIGCQPCTRAIQEGEDLRAGRWWWEDNSKKECGLHR